MAAGKQVLAKREAALLKSHKALRHSNQGKTEPSQSLLYPTTWHSTQPQQGLPGLLQPLQARFSQLHTVHMDLSSAGASYR